MTNIFKSKLYIIIVILGILTLAVGACTNSQKQVATATPLQVDKEGYPGEYIDLVIQVSSNQPCKLILCTSHKTEVDNYLVPSTSDTLTYPNSDGTVVFHEKIPEYTLPGDYILKVKQMRRDGDTEGIEIYRKDFKVKP
jgi:hypothetical protein